MSDGFWKNALRDNWYLMAILLVVIVAAVFLYSRSGSTSAEAEAGKSGQASSTAGVVAQPLEPHPVRQTEEENVRATLADYQKKVDADPNGADAPAYLNAMANLSRQKLLDYKEAARLYELILVQYPNWDMIAKVYPQLATCYERLGDLRNTQWVYKQMMDKFPAESPEYQYAQAQLGMPPSSS